MGGGYLWSYSSDLLDEKASVRYRVWVHPCALPRGNRNCNRLHWACNRPRPGSRTSNFNVFCLTRPGIEPPTSRMPGKCSTTTLPAVSSDQMCESSQSDSVTESVSELTEGDGTVTEGEWYSVYQFKSSFHVLPALLAKSKYELPLGLFP